MDRPAAEIKISNIIQAVDEEVKMLNCKKSSKKGCNNKSTKCITHNLWDQLDQHINSFFEKVKITRFSKTKYKHLIKMSNKNIYKNKEYKYGFSTDIESIKLHSGLNEDTIKFISKIKMSQNGC